MDVRILPPECMIETEIHLPLSKSMSNRALLMDALTPGPHKPFSVAVCDDTDVMRDALASPYEGNINIGAAGTAMRFLTAYYAATEGADVTIDGIERMRHRPISPLVDVLRACGAEIEYVGEEGFAPLHIKGKRLRGGNLKMDASVSSQFVSALLMVAPTFDTPTTLVLEGEPASLPYLEMTIEMMRRRGIHIERSGKQVDVTPGQYSLPADSAIEADWSAASYWYTIAALSAGWITLPGLKLPSLQGDSRVSSLFDKLGVITNNEEGKIELSASPEVYSRLDEDFSDTPDIVQTLVVACCMLGVPFEFTGVASLKIKETDRLEALKNEMLKFGSILEIEKGSVIKWNGRRNPIFSIPEIDTYGDHRMAMAFATAAVYVPGIVIKDCDVVNKSYPGFWDDMRSAGFEIIDAAQSYAPQAKEQ